MGTKKPLKRDAEMPRGPLGGRREEGKAGTKFFRAIAIGVFRQRGGGVCLGSKATTNGVPVPCFEVAVGRRQGGGDGGSGGWGFGPRGGSRVVGTGKSACWPG